MSTPSTWSPRKSSGGVHERTGRRAWSARPGQAVRLQGRRPDPPPGDDLGRRLGVQRRRHLRRQPPGRRHDRHVLPGRLPRRAAASSARASSAGTSSGSRDPDDAVRVTKAIDALFANSPFETLTQTEKAFAASFVKQMGNIELLILTIGAVVFFTLLLVTGNTMAIAVRERIRRAGGPEDGRLLRPARPAARPGRGRPHRRRRAASSAWPWPSSSSPA